MENDKGIGRHDLWGRLKLQTMHPRSWLARVMTKAVT